jgi:pSer/pThr/pTyr-binding forkhead associated (FHA) protein
MPLTLVVLDKEGNATQYPVDAKPEMILGRAAEVDVPLLSKNVSRKHAKLRVQGKKITVEDMGSSNGVLVNGTKISGPTEVPAGSEFQIGEFTVKITSQEPEVPEGPLGTLTGQNGTFLDKVLPVKAGDNVVGRGSECDVFVADGSISRKHAIMSVAGDKITVRDMGSANGTFVNGQKIQDITQLRHGEVVRFGSLSFRLDLANVAAGASAPAQPASSQPFLKAASAPQPIAAKVSAAQPAISKAASAPQPVARPKDPSVRAPVIAREPSGPAPIKAATPAAEPQSSGQPGAPTDWLKVGILLATPLTMVFALGIIGWTLFGSSSGGDLTALRAQMATNAAVESANTLKGQNKFIEAEAALMPVLEKNPGDPTARALYNTVHDEADNQRALQEAMTLSEAKDMTGALAKLSEIEETSALYADAKKLEGDIQKGSLVGTMRGAADACEAGDYSACLDRICSYITMTGETDPDVIALAKVAYGLKIQSAGAGESCVKDSIAPPQADKSKAEAEKLLANSPIKDFALAYFSGQSAQEVVTQMQEAANADAANKKAFDDAIAALSPIPAALEAFAKQMNEPNLNEAAKSAKIILDGEQKVFGKSIEGPSGFDVRKQLLTAFAKDFSQKNFSTTADFQEGKGLIKLFSTLDPNNNSPLRYAMAVRFQAALREIFEAVTAGQIQAGSLSEVAQYINGKSKLKALADAKIKELTPK